jgi:rhamnulokinase
MPVQQFIAFDFGAESGRAILGTLLKRKKLELKELRRFQNNMLQIGNHYYWNIYRLYEEVIHGLKLCVNEHDVVPRSIGIDTWGVDFGLIGKDGSLLRIPYSYRDPMTETAMNAFLERMSRSEIYGKTGIALHKFNTLYQLYAMKLNRDPLLDMVDKLLFIPDLLNYLLTGEARSEFTFATTSQLYNPNTSNWERSFFDLLGVPVESMQEVVSPGTAIGYLDQNISRAIDVERIRVIAVTSHDTASAIASVPAEGEDWAYISSGTWSLMGVENRHTIMDNRALMFNFTNEGGAEGMYTFHKNIMGLWLLQQSKKSWEKKQGALDYGEIIRLAERSTPFEAMIDPDYAGFYNPMDMPAAIDTFCRQTGQSSPAGVGPVARSILESLALKYRMVVDQLELVTGRTIHRIHIIGGGSKNDLLCQFTANATGRKVIAGPDEATAIGNILMQAIAQGYIENLSAARKVVMESFELKEFHPEDHEQWGIAYERFERIAKPS